MTKKKQEPDEKIENQQKRRTALAALTPLQATIILARRGNKKILQTSRSPCGES
jgi:hypothetical protein